MISELLKPVTNIFLYKWNWEEVKCSNSWFIQHFQD